MTPHRFLTWDIGIWLSRVGAEVMADAENGHTTIRLAMSRNTRRSSDVNFFLFFSTIPMLGTLFRKGTRNCFYIQLNIYFIFNYICTIDQYQYSITSVPQKNVPSTVVYYYCAWYVFLRDRH